jgi:fumarate hydratase subunit alpha
VREISVSLLTETLCELCLEANLYLNTDLCCALKKAAEEEESPVGRECLNNLVANAEAARENRLALCQDTGMVVVFAELGQEVRIVGGDFETAIIEGVRRGYEQGYFRRSVVNDPFLRENTGDNTPPVIYTRIVPGDKLRITVAPKGFGSENMGAVQMLTPAEGREGVKRFIVDTVRKAGANPCPPLVIGVGVGGTMEYAGLLAKKALLRPVGVKHIRPDLADFEEELLTSVNNLGIGPQGLGGRTTALAVHLEVYPTHIAGLPCAVNLSCHSLRHKTRVL